VQAPAQAAGSDVPPATGRRMTRTAGWRRALVVAGLIFLADQATKAAIVASRAVGEADSVFFGIELNHVRNTGVAFGALAGGGAIVWALTGAALAALIAYFAWRAQRRLLWLPVGAVLGGALGNLADRAREGAVIDFIDPIAWPAFNVADVAIVVGIMGFVYVIEATGEGRGQKTEDRGAA
jgi:signal peptidase II